MQVSQDSSATVAATQFEHPDSHYQHLRNALPDWVGQATLERRNALKAAQPRLTGALKAAPTAEQRALKALNADHWSAQSEVDQRLARLQDASAFAEPLLKDALKNQFDLDLDVRTTFLRLYIPVTVPGFPIKTGARDWTVSLLDAALHNFEAREAEADAYEAHSTFITAPSATGQFDTLPRIKEKLGIPAFITLCRSLDIGAQYQASLKEALGFSEPVGAAVLRLNIDASQQAALKAALQWARMHGDVSEQYVRLIGGLADGLQGMRIDGQALLCHDLTLMSARLTGIVVFAPDLEQARKAVRVVAYIPDDPEHPLKEYASTAEMAVELIRQLRSTDYQRFFSRFVDHEHRGVFFATLNSRLSKVEWHEPVQGSALPTWRDTPIDQPNLQFAITPIGENLWLHLYQGKLNKILNDARTLAVSTASADQKARWALWDSFANVASAILQAAALVVAPFVPVLGELMMGYMAYQLLDETFEGVIEWAEGQTTEAFEHLMGAVESLVQLGVFAAGAAIGVGEYRKVLPQEVVAFIDRFKPVKLANGQTRYWKPDLSVYETSPPAPDSKTNELGLRPHQDKNLLSLDQVHYAVSEGPVTGQYQIEHPTRPAAYKPQLRHNGDGAWHTELEEPLEWDRTTALRRIGHCVEGFSDAQREQILQVSGVPENALRKMHVNQEPLPPLLADSIKRFQIDQDLERFIEQLDSDLSDQYLRADPVTQLQLLTEHHRWPSGKRLRFIDEHGDIAWTSSTDDTLPVTALRQDSLTHGDLLMTLLQSLDESAAKALLDEPFGSPTPALDVRARTLRKQLAHLARAQRTTLFESRYTTLEQNNDPLFRQIALHDPQLPASVTRELLDTATGEELAQIRAGQLPARQHALIDLANQEVRVTRAFEGLALDSVNNPDTDTLALHSLQQLPGWTGDVRIDVRDRTFDGPLLDSTGQPQAAVQKVLVRQADGRYQACDARGQALHSVTDFYASVLYALPDAERLALDIHIGQAEQLKASIRQHPLDRNELRVTISHPPIQAPVTDTLRLVRAEGYRRLLRTVNAANEQPLTLQQRIQQLYPAYSPEDVETLLAILQGHADGPRTVLSRLRNEFTRLAEDLTRWVYDMPTVDRNGRTLTQAEFQDARHTRRLFKRFLLQCWRQETFGPIGYTLYVPGSILGDLPPLSADFSHVDLLQINGSAGTRGLNEFLQNLAGVQHLDIQDFALPGLPSAITSMPNLRQLVVRNSGITLSLADQQLLPSLKMLSVLDLQDNPLTLTPDLHALPALRDVNLANTGITMVPANLLDHPQLIIGNFSGNRLTELPEPLYTLNSDLSNGFNFANNPLSTAARERIKAHYMRTGKHFGVVAEQADTDRVRALFPQHNVRQATDLLYRLPGTLADGRAQLTRWEAELTRLLKDLGQWQHEVADRNPATGQLLTINEMFNEHVARESFARQVEQFWRNRISQHPDRFRADLKFIGELPVLAADFSHVPSLTLTGNLHVSAIDRFLQRFIGLRSLTLSQFALDQVPQAITHMPLLDTLLLDHCGVVLTPEGQAALASRPNLKSLELTHNPLGAAPDLASLPELSYLDLSYSALTAVPAGLADHPNLRTAVLESNRMTELPETLFSLPAERIDGLDFADNPFSAETRERIKTCFHATGQDFGVHADPADIALTLELFPSLDEQDASDVIYGLPGTLEAGRAQLNRWRAELTQLTDHLQAWTGDTPSYHPVTGQPLTIEQIHTDSLARTEFAERLKQYWRDRPDPVQKREDNFNLDLIFVGDLPRLTADFSHVSTLTLNGNPAIGSTDAFLELFPNLHTLDLQNLALKRVPQALTQMPGLRELIITRCQLPMNAEGQAVLSALDGLEALDLSENPLAVAPDLARMPLLNELRLSNTGITGLPNGFSDLDNLRIASLHGNRISQLPEELFSIGDEVANGINLSNNPLSAASRERIKAWYATTGIDFVVLAEKADIDRAQALFPGLDSEDASHMVYKLPGTLADGRAQLTRWEGEIARLTSDLNRWANDIPAQHPTMGHSLNGTERLGESIERKLFAKKLEQLWRQRPAQAPELRENTFTAHPSFIGDMPSLSTDFSHVTMLSLTGHEALGINARFLECFSGLQHLELRNFNLGQIPPAITGMRALEFLVLSRCRVALGTEGQAALASLSRLKMLDLFDNPLGTVPDVTPLQALTFIDLSNTGIDRVPTGLPGLAQLRTVLLRDNRISELPEALYQLSGKAADGFDFSNNPLSAATLDRLKIYHRENASDFGAWADPVDTDQVIALYPDMTTTEASTFIFGLPGTMAEGRAELARLVAEFQRTGNRPDLSTLRGDTAMEH